MKNNKKLTETEEYTWQYITRDFNEIGKLNISELSQAINVSNATIIRTLKKKGYGGFLFLDAKNMALVEHYQNTLGAIRIGGVHPYRMLVDESAAQKLLEIYSLKEE